MNGSRLFAIVCSIVASVCILQVSFADERVDFRGQIRPLLSDACFQCHGPDEAAREADLRLDLEAEAIDHAIVPGEPDESEVLTRILSDDPDEEMPPRNSGKSLTEDQIELIRRWIAEGARYEQHWAFDPPTRPDVPTPQESEWVINPIDAFVLSHLEQQGVTPSPAAAKTTLLRRLHLDLIGLPPEPNQVDAFARASAGDYEHQVDRLLGSQHFGERWARIWLDAARYADSNGYEKDVPREMWFYRDWIIRAFNNDMPYDQFIIHQIAGDLLPDAGPQQRVATGFLRNSMVNEEGGADPEQFRMEAMYDRIDAIGKSVLGVTIQCAQCHSHKYDPLTQDEYYRMFACLNNTHDAIIPVYTPDEERQRQDVLRAIAAIEDQLKSELPNWPERLSAWEANEKTSAGQWEILKPTKLPYEGQKFRVLDDHSILSESYAPKSSAPSIEAQTQSQQITGFRLELLTHPKLPRRGPGRGARGTAALSEMTISVAPLGDPSKREKLKLVAATADVNPARHPQPEYLRDIKAKEGDKRVTGPIEMAIDGDKQTAWTTDSDPGRRNQPRKAVFVPEKPVGFANGTVITFVPTMNHGGWNNNDNHNCLMGRYRFSLTTDADPVADPLPQRVREILKIEWEQRTASQREALFSYWRTTVGEWEEANAKIEALWKQYPEGTTQLVLEERSGRRATSLLERGDFLKPRHLVEPGVPEFLHDLPELGDTPARLAFARWLVDRNSPTTARSIVNRIWQAYFGLGLVETSDDLGSQGATPSHPELLDWLAVELMENDWSLKHIHRLIVSSRTYRQSSNITPASYASDPYNRLLARGPRFRVDAEVVRDITLAASGLLNPTVGGRSVYPPAPRFLFDPPASYGPKTWNEEQGDQRYRRGLYTFRFRSVPYPMLETFDAVPGNISCVRRNRSNTPLQALTSLNEPLFMECARALAKMTIRDSDDDDTSRMVYAMKRCVSREPDAEEIETLSRMLAKQRQRLTAGELDASEIAGEGADREQAAWTLLARVMLNLDETITKE